jgi:hypothetical protein
MGSSRVFQCWFAGVCVALAISPAVQAQSCDYLDAAPRPSWVSVPPVSSNLYFGVGAQELGSQQPFEALRLAKQAALNDLSSNIEVTLSSELTAAQQVSSQGGREEVSRQVASVTRIVTSSTLKEIQIRETWLDRKSCTFWVLGAVTRESVEALRNAERQRAKLQELERLLQRIADTKQPVESRQSDLGLALALYGEINFAVLENDSAKSSYEQRLNEIASKVGADYQQAREAQSLLDEADLAASQARIARSVKERALYGQAAASGYESVIGRFPFGRGNHYWAETASFRLADLNRTQNNSCAAVNYYERVRDNSASSDWARKAEEALSLVSCGAEERSQSMWMSSLSGKEYGLICLYRANGKIQEWKNICDKMKDKIQQSGGVAKPLKLERARYAALFDGLKDGDSSGVENNGNLVIALADGEIGTRSNKQNPTGADYQFKGEVAVHVISAGEGEFQDQFSGAGGWNPISRQMAMEVLGVIVFNRWQERYGTMVGAK